MSSAAMEDVMVLASPPPPQHNHSDSQQQPQQQQQVLDSQHQDYILAAALDVYGRRLATCGGDRFVRVWDLDGDGRWAPSGPGWQAHRGAVACLAWAHPEFGSLLATGGTDHDAKIWEELQTSNNSSSATANANVAVAAAASVTAAAAATTSSRWTCKASLTEARRGVTAVEFAPRHWGLKLATASADGCARVYEAVDVMNLAQWPLAATLADHQAAPSAGSAGSASAPSAASLGGESSSSEAGGCAALSWCTGRFDPPTVAVAGGRRLVLFRYSDAARAWQAVLQLATTAAAAAAPPGSAAAACFLDVAWAPNVGRRYHTLAAAHEDGVTVYQLSRSSNSNSNNSTNNNNNSNNANAMTLLSQQEIGGSAWRCQWNVTGTVLATSGDGGRVRLYKADHRGRFRCAAQISAGAAGAPAAAPGGNSNRQSSSGAVPPPRTP